eukprot:CAMPEP_0174295632 /NCGR_PEP_ID=MMETSP0809-20121228/45419_1 /TAXON_ID=73025 ORGANISM="Eutreptiella gymnastica-like, Strain CCMP1594" /NCGR_SAMPLE_ID=MMETSP0809 /ASSEMBLY_ACC=CAM_ASM_000658 /LENGTH=97 /DNA_ID=CAMNT_0015398079 /DNA_START=907 /DNA_END=1197 /DNA_ORIENTATION=+
MWRQYRSVPVQKSAPSGRYRVLLCAPLRSNPHRRSGPHLFTRTTTVHMSPIAEAWHHHAHRPWVSPPPSWMVQHAPCRAVAEVVRRQRLRHRGRPPM